MFLICLKIIAKYSAKLETVTQELHAADMDMLGVRDYINLFMKAFRAHRDGADRVFSENVISHVKILAWEPGTDLTMPWRCVGGSIEEYYRRTICDPYMGSLIQYLERRHIFTFSHHIR